MPKRLIRLRGVRVHNLQGVDLDVPRGRLVVICGVSGSGKTSLALDTLYAEGQRRYVETFSAYTRQFLERLDKPAADRIDGIPPAVAVTARQVSRSSRATIGSATETTDYLRLLMAKIGQVICEQCGEEVRRDTAETTAAEVAELPAGTRLLIAYPIDRAATESIDRQLADLRQAGAVRVLLGERLLPLSEVTAPAWPTGEPLYVVIDRLVAGRASAARCRETIEAILVDGHDNWSIFAALPTANEGAGGGIAAGPPMWRGVTRTLDGRPWLRRGFSTRRTCGTCGRQYADPDPRLLSFNSPLGACPECEGFGSVVDIDMDLVVPDPSKSLRDGAIVPWRTPAFAHELDELLALASDYGIPVDAPFQQLTAAQRQLIVEGVPERDFGGLRGFFAWLERRKYKMHLRVFLSRWRSYRPCPVCHGKRLRSEALAVRVGGQNMADLGSLEIDRACEFFRDLPLSDWQQAVGRVMLDQVRSRLGYLRDVGLGYLTLDRTLRTLSRGETQRVTLTAALGSSLAGMLYVLDEPSVGLHPSDIRRLIGILHSLRDRGNTVVVVEHEEAILRAADQLIEFGPAAGVHGGQVIFHGSPRQMIRSRKSPTGQWLAGRRGVGGPPARRPTDHGWIQLNGARGHNLRDLTVRFPLSVLCVVTGVSGAGKSTLVEGTLVPALTRRLRKEAPKPQPHDDLLGTGQIDQLVMIDQGPVGRSSRSNPVTYIKAFDQIRTIFADTIEARTNNFGPGRFSFNVDGGRCEQCRGEGQIAIDMQFLADVYMRCSQCHGSRYRHEILQVKYRGRSIAEVLDMTVLEAFAFFRGHPKVQTRLKLLSDVGLDYLRLGQRANTLSGGEAQRLKLASHLALARRGRTLFVLDEPTSGLHFSDIVKLLDCFDSLIAVGHSLLVVEQNVQLLKAADYVIELGPGAAHHGGQIIACGTPEQVAQNPQSVTGPFLSTLTPNR